MSYDIDPLAAPRITIARLSQQRQAVATIRRWFEEEWPSYYGPGGAGDAAADLADYADDAALPVGIVAFCNGTLCGVAALKTQTIEGFAHLSPWAGAGYVVPAYRGRGIGAALLAALADEARRFGFTTLYCATATSASLLERTGWQLRESTIHGGERVAVYEKAL